MSHHPLRAAPQPQATPSSSQTCSEPAQRIEYVRKAARALLAVPEPTAAHDESPDPHPSPDARGVIRCWRFSPGAVQHERKLLQEYGVEDFRGLLARLFMLLTGVVKIMKSTHHDVRVKGEVIASLGCLLEQASVLVLRMRTIYDKVERADPYPVPLSLHKPARRQNLPPVFLIAA